MSEIYNDKTIPSKITEKYYKKYYQDSTSEDYNKHYQDVTSEKNIKFIPTNVYTPLIFTERLSNMVDKIIQEDSYDMFLEQKLGYTGKRKIRGAYFLKPQYLEVERFTIGILGLISFLILIISIVINNTYLLFGASIVFLTILVGMIFIYLINKILLSE